MKLIAVALFLALSGCREKPPPEPTAVVVAARDLPAGEVLRFELVAQLVVPASMARSGVILPDQAQAVMGRKLKVAVEQGTPLREEDLE